MRAEIEPERAATVSKALRVLFVQTTRRPSAETRVARDLLSALPAANQLAVMMFQGVATAGSQDDRLMSEFRVLRNTVVHELPIGSLGSPRRGWRDVGGKLADLSLFLRSRPRLRAAARSFHPHLVYSAQQTWDLRVATPLANLLGVPQVIHLHYNCANLRSAVIEDLRRANLVIGVSDFTRADAIEHGVHPDRVRTLYNSITLPAQSPAERAHRRGVLCAELHIEDPCLLVGILARLTPWKGQLELLNAMLPILQEDRRVHLLVAGAEYPKGNGMSDQIAKAAEVAGARKQVHVLGQRSDAAEIFASLDIYAQPSRLEPCSLAVLQAQANGLPVVAWREGGTAELVADEETGFLVPPMDINALSSAIRRLLNDEEVRVRMGAAARKRAANCFAPEAASADFVSLLRATQ
jgi:glycosyltransferase involved in cell wall biosynthesis